MHLAVMSWDAATLRVTKWARFDTQGEAAAHVAARAGQYPEAFAVEYNGPLQAAIVDPIAKTVSVGSLPQPDIDAATNGDALRERQRAEKKAHALSLIAQGKTEEAMKELLELI